MLILLLISYLFLIMLIFWREFLRTPALTKFLFFFFQEEDGIRYLVRSCGLGDVYKRQRLFRGEEFDASTPWQYFTAHSEEWLAESIREGRFAARCREVVALGDQVGSGRRGNQSLDMTPTALDAAGFHAVTA